jgi:hypothetical protein
VAATLVLVGRHVSHIATYRLPGLHAVTTSLRSTDYLTPWQAE